MSEVNNHPGIRVKNCKAHSFELDLDTSAYATYLRGGIVTQVSRSGAVAFCCCAVNLMW